MSKFKIFFGFIVLLNSFAFSQIPNSDIWLFKLQKQNNVLIAEMPVNITNRSGYDNQPSFSKDEKSIYFTSIRNDKQADIYLYNIKSKKTIQITKTQESEYSPQLINNIINCVVVKKDSSQHLMEIDAITGKFIKEYVIDSVGYYHWINKDTALIYKLTQPHSLQLYNSKNNNLEFIAFNPIRSFNKINNKEFIYGIKDSLKLFFYIYNIQIKKSTLYCVYPSINEDFIWHKEFGLLMSENSKILRYDNDKKTWNTFVDLTSFSLKNITRFYFDDKNKKLILVNNIK
ncbi:MAG: hypothetical protein LCH32_10390 [Bacteroidetes bacterium]|nr:hypothetical protein [Bacteroidota bacterium]